MASQPEISPTVLPAFQTFIADLSLFALPLTLSSTYLTPLPPIPYPNPSQPEPDFPSSLSLLEDLITPKNSLYLILRRSGSCVAVTYVPHLAPSTSKSIFLKLREKLVEELGQNNFSAALICKEVGEVLDRRAWEERDRSCEEMTRSGDAEKEKGDFRDMGYKSHSCRLCDRRMKTKIDEDAQLALREGLKNGGDCVQLRIHIPTETLTLTHLSTSLPPASLPPTLPSSTPSFTFYHHPETHLLIFIYCCPDTAPVRERMMYTVALPGLLNLIVKEEGVIVDRKVEIHGAEELELEEGGMLGGEKGWMGLEALARIYKK